MTPLKAAQPQKKPERRATIIEDVEDEDERKMNEKEKAQGPAILKDVEDEHEWKMDEKMKVETDMGYRGEGESMSNTSMATKILQQLKETKDKAIHALRKWTSKQQQDKVTVSLFKALITAPIDDAVQTLRDLQHPFRHILRGMGNSKPNSTIIPAVLQMVDTAMKFTVNCLLNSGATGCYIDKLLARELGLDLKKLAHPIPVYNVDRTQNEGGPIQFIVSLHLKVGDHVEMVTLAVTNTGPNKIILGHSWLWKHNPNIDWTHAQILFNCCLRECGMPQLWEEDENMIGILVDDDNDNKYKEVEGEDASGDKDMDTLEEGERLFVLPEDVKTIRATYTISQHITEEEERIKKLKANTPVPDRYVKDFSPIFEKSSFDTLPPQQKWDHAIELKDNCTPFTSKIYPLSKDKQHQLDEFVEEHLKSGRIRPSKSPIASPFFIVKKKDGTLHPVQDYR